MHGSENDILPVPYFTYGLVLLFIRQYVMIDLLATTFVAWKNYIENIKECSHSSINALNHDIRI